MPDRKRRPPISIRRAIALALDLGLRRDPFHSLVVPALLRAPWALTLALLPPFETLEEPGPVIGIATVALLADFGILLVTGAMLRLRARSVFNTPPGTRPAPARECYASALRRVPWLLVTEVVRNFTLGVAASFTVVPSAFVRWGLAPETFLRDLARNVMLLAAAGSLVVPVLFLGFRLAVATESVVLDEQDMAGAFQRSFRIMTGRFERWLELVASSGGVILALLVVAVLAGELVPAVTDTGQLALFWMLVIAVMPLIQYAWTFFYLRLAEVDAPPADGPPVDGDLRGAPPRVAAAARRLPPA